MTWKCVSRFYFDQWGISWEYPSLLRLPTCKAATSSGLRSQHCGQRKWNTRCHRVFQWLAIHSVKKEEDGGAEVMEQPLKKKALFYKVGENFKTDSCVIAPKTVGLLKEHVRRVEGKGHTRFPPVRNGIGYAKAININFGYAKVGNKLE
ncbi:unnamed protein product [Bursaphelenchus xylophilus]|uniref:(pine wood nematode) hypothetical protein n=1 Tax=Bursaphelenchus xylophilus TaxID=6326 RepID=A0A1I7RTX0_BURXY|nr:unnamed protein product [Bursaphelenchus xylophilus]CAG9132129.1 unnamed protein product [Bursaphelenchus xylophilus]